LGEETLQLLGQNWDGLVGLGSLSAGQPVSDLVDRNDVYSADQLLYPEAMGVATGQAKDGIDHA
jgi:hypothetical protein